MTTREPLDVTLAKAEAALDADSVQGSHKLVRVRAYCHQLRAAIVELDNAQTAGNADKARAYCRDLRTACCELNPSATLPFHCLEASCDLLRSPRTTCWLGFIEGMTAATRQLEASAYLTTAPAAAPPHAVRRPDIETSAQKPVLKKARAEPSLLRQTVGFLSLNLAYLAYFHVDVQLQIMMLPSISA